MKKTIISLLALAGVAAAAEVLTLDLSALNSPGTLIGGDSSTALTTSSAFDNTTDYATLTGLFTETGKWYASYGYNNNINTSTGNGVPSSALGAVLVAGGPVQNGRSTIGGIEFTLTAAQLAQFDGPLTLSFEVAHHYGNDNKNHQISFYLLTGAVTLTSEIYNSKSGSNLLEESSVAQSPFSTVSLAYTADQVDAMKATGKDQTFAFVAYTDAINGSNTGFLMKNFQMSGFAAPAVPEPTTATLSLLALAGLAARRRRK
jgi:hypothetical protein